MNDTEQNKKKIKIASAAIQTVEKPNDELTKSVLLDYLDPVNKKIADKTEKFVNDKLKVDESWGVARCCIYTTTVSGIMLLLGYLLAITFEFFIEVNGKLSLDQISFFNYSVKTIAVIAFVLIAKAYARMSDKALGYSGFIFAFSLMLFFSLTNSFEKSFG